MQTVLFKHFGLPHCSADFKIEEKLYSHPKRYHKYGPTLVVSSKPYQSDQTSKLVSMRNAKAITHSSNVLGIRSSDQTSKLVSMRNANGNDSF